MSYGSAGQAGGRPSAQLPFDQHAAYTLLDGMTGGRDATIAMLNGTRLPGAELAGPELSPARPMQLASAGAVVLPGFGGGVGARVFPPIGGVTVERLASGALRVGTSELSAAMLLSELDAARERAAVLDAVARFNLNRNDAVDVLAARAYVWADRMAPMSFWSLPWSGPIHDQVAQTIMQYERDHPGVTGLATRGNTAALAAIGTIVNEITAGVLDDPTVLERTSSVAPALSTNSSRARAALGTVALPQWQAHHLIPFAVMASLPVPVQQAIVAAGWVIDSAENLIALPANYAAFIGMPNLTRLPWHNSAHAQYDADVRTALVPVVAGGVSMTPVVLRAALFTVENIQRTLLVARRYHDRVH
jgi:hypothetical protein